MPAPAQLHRRAIFWLIAGTAVWGLSFPLVKVLHLRHSQDDWMLSCWLLVIRCFFAALLLAIWQPAMLRHITRREWMQSLGLILFGGPGLLLQAQGLSSTNASTSAFLTQFYCVLLPLWACIRTRRPPSSRILLATLLVLIGMGLLAGFDWRSFRLGRGETLTILASVCFTGQISLLEMPRFADNRSSTITILSLAGTALLAAAFALPATPQPLTYLSQWLTWPDLLLLSVLTFGCTLFSYLMMNRWQKFVSGTEAGLVYCLEPVCAAAFALVLPAWLSQACSVSYSNEQLTSNLIQGSLLVTLANVLLHWPGRNSPHTS